VILGPSACGDLRRTLGRDVSDLEKALVNGIKTAGLRPARETALLDTGAKLGQKTELWATTLEAQVMAASEVPVPSPANILYSTFIVMVSKR
jgi:hypothetical protein